MSQCFTCDYELRGYMAMGKQVLTLTYTHAIPFGNLRFQRLSHSTKIANTSSRDTPLAYVKSYVLMFLCPINPIIAGYAIGLSYVKSYVTNGTLVYVLLSNNLTSNMR